MFIPVFFMGGVVGRVFREFAATISVAILVSGFVSLTLTPMLCARILKGHKPHAKRERVLARGRRRGRTACWPSTAVTLDVVLKARLLVLLLTIGSVFADA